MACFLNRLHRKYVKGIQKQIELGSNTWYCTWYFVTVPILNCLKGLSMGYCLIPYLWNYTFWYGVYCLMLALTLSFERYLTRKTTHIFTSSQLKNKQTKRIGHLAASIKTGRKMLPGQSTSYKLIEAGPAPRLLVPSLRTLIEKDQYSQREDASTVGPSPISVPPWSPRRYLPLEPLMATRPCSRNSRKKSSGFSPSEHTRPLLETYQNFSFTPAEGYQWIIV